jgi:ABC-type phosphate transport system permease subunit
MGEVAQGSLHYNTLFAIGIILFITTATINYLAGRFVGTQKIRQRGGQL